MSEPGKPHAPGKPTGLLVCVNPISGANKPCCGGRGSETLAAALEKGIAERRIDVTLKRIRCLNKCHHGPSMRLAPAGRFLLGVSEADIPAILDALERECGKRPGEDATDLGLFYPGG